VVFPTKKNKNKQQSMGNASNSKEQHHVVFQCKHCNGYSPKSQIITSSIDEVGGTAVNSTAIKDSLQSYFSAAMSVLCEELFKNECGDLPSMCANEDQIAFNNFTLAANVEYTTAIIKGTVSFPKMVENTLANLFKIEEFKYEYPRDALTLQGKYTLSEIAGTPQVEFTCLSTESSVIFYLPETILSKKSLPFKLCESLGSFSAPVLAPLLVKTEDADKLILKDFQLYKTHAPLHIERFLRIVPVKCVVELENKMVLTDVQVLCNGYFDQEIQFVHNKKRYLEQHDSDIAKLDQVLTGTNKCSCLSLLGKALVAYKSDDPGDKNSKSNIESANSASQLFANEYHQGIKLIAAIHVSNCKQYHNLQADSVSAAIKNTFQCSINNNTHFKHCRHIVHRFQPNVNLTLPYFMQQSSTTNSSCTLQFDFKFASPLTSVLEISSMSNFKVTTRQNVQFKTLPVMLSLFAEVEQDEQDTFVEISLYKQFTMANSYGNSLSSAMNDDHYGMYTNFVNNSSSGNIRNTIAAANKNYFDLDQPSFTPPPSSPSSSPMRGSTTVVNGSPKLSCSTLRLDDPSTRRVLHSLRYEYDADKQRWNMDSVNIVEKHVLFGDLLKAWSLSLPRNSGSPTDEYQIEECGFSTNSVSFDLSSIEMRIEGTLKIENRVHKTEIYANYTLGKGHVIVSGGLYYKLVFSWQRSVLQFRRDLMSRFNNLTNVTILTTE